MQFLSWFFAIWMMLPVGVTAQVTLSPPTFPSSNTVRFTLTGSDPNTGYRILYTPNLVSNISGWGLLGTGTVGQTVLTFGTPTNPNAFFLAASNTSIPPKVSTPVFTPPGGSYDNPTSVVVTVANPANALIYYTTNTAIPTTSDTLVPNGGSVSVLCSTRLQARAFAPGFVDSDVRSNYYTINCAPTVNAGPQQIVSGSTATLTGTATDDGLPTATLTHSWTRLRGPSASIASPSALSTSVSLTGGDGVYEFQFVVSDSVYSATSRVVVARNPKVSVALTEPANGATATVPTNVLLKATASTTSGSVTQVAFYASGVFLGVATTSPYNFEWRNAFAGNHAMTAVAFTTDANNTGLASDGVNFAVSFPTNVGQLTLALTDLQIPVPGEPLRVARRYDSRFNAAGDFGNNWKSPYEDIQISADALSSGWEGFVSVTYCVRETTAHLITVSLSENEKYYFTPQVVFTRNGNPCVNVANPAGCLADEQVRYELVPIPGGQGQLTLTQPSTVRLWDYEDGYTGPMLIATLEEDEFGFCEATAYEPALSDYTFTAPDGTQYQFTSAGKLFRKIDRNSNQFEFTSGGITYSHPGVSGSAKQVTFTRDGNNRITEVYDPIALATSGQPALKYAYDSQGRLTNYARLIVRSPATYENLAYAYINASFPNHLTTITDQRGVVIQRTEFDAFGRLAREFDSGTNVTAFGYDIPNRRYFITNKLAYVFQQIFADSGLLAKSINPLNGTISYGYDERGRRLAETNELGHVIRYAYDSQDNLTAITNRLGFVGQFIYGAFQLPIASIDALNRGVTNGYDGKGNLIATTNALGFVTRYSYDAQGNRTAETNHLNEVTRFGSDAFGNLAAITNALTKVIRHTYDENGNRRTEVDPLNRTNLFDFDAANRRVKITYPDNTSEGVSYNQRDKKLRETNQANVVTAYGYDNNYRLTSVTNALGTTNQIVTRYAYDGEGQLIAITDANNHTTRLVYNPAGRRTQRLLPAAAPFPSPPTYSETIAYDASGNPTNRVDFNGDRTFFVYDAEGRLKQKSGEGAVIATFSYDANGLRTNMTDASGVTTYSYDALQRLTNKAGPQGNLAYAYDAANRLLTTLSSAPNGTKTTNRWNALGFLTNVIDRFGNVTRYDYDDAGNVKLLRHANGVTNNYSYDALNRLTKLVATKTGGTILARYSQQFASTGHRTNITELSGRKTTYAYDLLYRLRTETISSDPGGFNGSVNYELDAVGNRLKRVSTVTGLASATNTYSENEYISGDKFDQNGNVITNAANVALRYNLDDQLTNYNNGAVVIVYDGDGNRVKKTVGGVTTLYLVDDLNATGYAQVLEELSATNATPVRLYTYGLTALSQRTSAGTTHYFGHDGLGSVRYLTDASGNSTDTYSYDAFGELLASTGTTTNFIRYVGEHFDADLQFYYLRARYLNHRQGRLISQDPLLGYPQAPSTLHRYFYAAAEPVSGRDPTGKENSQSSVSATGISVGLASLPLLVQNASTIVQRSTFVYRAIEGGIVRYVGITFNFTARAAAHLLEKGIKITKIPGLSNLSRADSRAVEQLLIEAGKRGPNADQLLNQINSISPSNPLHDPALARSAEVLRQAGYTAEGLLGY